MDRPQSPYVENGISSAPVSGSNAQRGRDLATGPEADHYELAGHSPELLDEILVKLEDLAALIESAGGVASGEPRIHGAIQSWMRKFTSGSTKERGRIP